MEYIKQELAPAVKGLSDKNYEQSLDFYRLWFDIGCAHADIKPTQAFGDIWTYHCTNYSQVNPGGGQLFRPAAHLIVRFAGDLESDPVIGPLSAGLQNRLCARLLQSFFGQDMIGAWQREGGKDTRGYDWSTSELQDTERYVASDSNLIALWANLGYVEETVIRDRILQSLISFPKLYDHQADAMIILFKIAGATFEAPDSVKGRLVQEVLEPRERGWEGIPPPPIFTSTKAKSAGAGKEDSSATPIVTSLGLPRADLELQVTMPPPTEPAAAPETETVPESPVTRSPSISIATLSDFTTADISDAEFPVDPTAITPHNTFYLEDGNVEVLCGNTLFRVHPTILFFHSPALRQMFAQPSLASVESPNGCPRILSSDTAADFAALLNMIYLPRPPKLDKAPDFTSFSSLLRVTAKYEMPAVRSHLLKAVRDAYPENFEGVTATKPLGETVFSGPSPHPNEVLNLFIQQKFTSALPMAYYMVAQRGLNSLMDRSLPQSATLPPEVLQSTIGGLMAIREVELNETHHLIFGQKGTHPCSESKCLSNTLTGPAVLEADQRVFNHIVGSSQRGTKALQVPKFYVPGNTGSGNQDYMRMFPGICDGCTGRWESGHADLRAKVWAMLPSAFGLQ